MKITIAATTIALAALAAPAFAQPSQPSQPVQSGDTATISAPAPAQVKRSSHGFRINDGTANAHSERVQKIFDELRAEEGTGTTQ